MASLKQELTTREVERAVQWAVGAWESGWRPALHTNLDDEYADKLRNMLDERGIYWE